jgi:hypothetical protein
LSLSEPGLWLCSKSAQPTPRHRRDLADCGYDRALGQGHDDQMRRFVDDDDSYLEWLAAHPEGFVINTERSPRAAYVMLHRSSCRTIGGTPIRGGQWTHDYIKVCGDRNELEEFARLDVGGPAQPCALWL